MSGTDFNGLPPAGELQLGDVFALQRGTGQDSTKQTTLEAILDSVPTPFVQVTQAEYDALTPDPDTLYIVVG